MSHCPFGAPARNQREPHWPIAHQLLQDHQWAAFHNAQYGRFCLSGIKSINHSSEHSMGLVTPQQYTIPTIPQKKCHLSMCFQTGLMTSLPRAVQTDPQPPENHCESALERKTIKRQPNTENTSQRKKGTHKK